MFGDATAFISLVFGFFFYCIAKSDFPPPGSEHADLSLLIPGGLILLGAWGLTLLARDTNSKVEVITRISQLAGNPF